MKKALKYISYAILAFLAFSLVEVVACRFIDPPGTPLMLLRKWRLGKLDYRFMELNSISPNLQRAVIASEDQAFMTHRGFDWVQVKKATNENQRRKRPRGASTISMQVARNMFLWQGGGYFRKGMEVYYTALIETFWSKRRIMEVYLNVAEMGKGIFGAEAAAQTYFKIPASRLSAEQSALIAAILPSPQKYSAANPGSYVQSRRNDILDQMPMFKAME